MAYRVRTESFEGPFDLLLYLVNRQRIDVGSLNISRIANQYLAEVAQMQRLDLDVASDFLVVAATLLEIKAASLIPRADADLEEEFEELQPNEARELLLSRLLEYKKFKNAAAALQTRQLAVGRCHARTFGAPAEFLNLHPDYLENVALEDLARLVVACHTRRDRFLLESEHIAGKPIALESYVESVHDRLRQRKRLMFSELIPKHAPASVVVVTFLALLELMKRNMVRAYQEEAFGDIRMEYREGSGPLSESGPIDDYGQA